MSLPLKLFAWLLFTGQVSSLVSAAPEVHIKNGTVVGKVLSSFSQDFFGGIPYAQPPVGDLRLRRPARLNSSFSGTFDASEYGAICPGHGTDDIGYTESEDCLTINVVRPQNVTQGAKLPIMLWIHGGGYVEGSSRDVRYNESYIVQRSVEIGSPILGVSINYRLSAWGFLSSREIAYNGLSNLGLWDQRLAFEWVQENIAAFGGDPSKVTIWGESAGAMAVSTHVIAFNGRNDHLFRAAIMESGSPTTEIYKSPDQSQPAFDSIVSAVNCTDAQDVVACLRTVSEDAFFAATGNITFGTTSWMPVIDGDLLPRFPSQMLKDGAYIKGVAVLSGANTDEGVSFGPAVPVNSDAQIVSLLNSTANGFARQSVLEKLVSLYSDDPADGAPFGTGDLPSIKGGSLNKKSDAIFGDLTMIGTRRNFVETLAKTQDAWSYRFNHHNPIANASIGIQHFSETPYVFDNPLPFSPVGTVPIVGTATPRGDRPGDLLVAKIMQTHWISFAAHLDPNAHGVEGVPFWPSYANGTMNMVYANSTEGGTKLEKDDFRAAGIAFINEFAMDFSR